MEEAVLVVMDRTDASAHALEYVFREYPETTIVVTHVTEANDPIGLFGIKNPAEYMVPKCGCEHDAAILPPEDLFNRAQRRRAEQVFDRACSLADYYVLGHLDGRAVTFYGGRGLTRSRTVCARSLHTITSTTLSERTT